VRRRTRNFVLVIAAIVVVLIALGALPGLLKSGDPYYVTATTTEETVLTDDNRSAINVTTVPTSRYPYTSEALATATASDSGRSDPYWEGPIGIKEAFTHSPFDEMRALQQRNATAATAEGVFVRDNGTLYQLALTQESNE
jgi:hypothetical protein